MICAALEASSDRFRTDFDRAEMLTGHFDLSADILSPDRPTPKIMRRQSME